MTRKTKGIQVLEILGAKNIEGYSLINNYGYTFEIDGTKYDVRYWANCYGVALNRWETMPTRTEPRPKTEEEKKVCEQVDVIFNKIGAEA